MKEQLFHCTPETSIKKYTFRAHGAYCHFVNARCHFNSINKAQAKQGASIQSAYPHFNLMPTDNILMGWPLVCERQSVWLLCSDNRPLLHGRVKSDFNPFNLYYVNPLSEEDVKTLVSSWEITFHCFNATPPPPFLSLTHSPLSTHNWQLFLASSITSWYSHSFHPDLKWTHRHTDIQNKAKYTI